MIPTYLRSESLSRVLPSYLATAATEIVIVEDGSGPPHADRVASLADDARVRVVALERNLGLPAARNAGLREARTDWVVFGEDDVWFARDYADTLLEHAQAAGARVASGETPLVDPALLDDPRALDEAIATKPMLDAAFDRFLGAPWPVEHLRNGDVLTPLLTSKAAVHRSVFERVGFDSTFRGNAFREETDFFFTCAELGVRLLRCPHARAGHMKPHARALAGGSWSMSRSRYAAQMIANNWRLVRAHGELIRSMRERAGLRGGPLRAHAAFLASLARRARPVRA